MTTEKIIRRLTIPDGDTTEFFRREWLLTNGLGGYAGGTIDGFVSRRYHGLLVAALPAPLGRVVMFNHLGMTLLRADGSRVPLEAAVMTEFRLENQTPVWRYEIDDIVIERTVRLIAGQNTVHIGFQLLTQTPHLQLELQPYFQFRLHEQDVGEIRQQYALTVRGQTYEISLSSYPPVRLHALGQPCVFTHAGDGFRELVYQKEAERGYHSRGQLWTPGYFTLPLRHSADLTLVASTEAPETATAISPKAARDLEADRCDHLLAQADPRVRESEAAPLILAADQFITAPLARVEDVARARAIGEEVRTIIAGYHWFTDWGRDTMISLEGLTLLTGRRDEARSALKTFAYHIRDGLIPNLFPEGEAQGLYHTADATLWFFHALDRYVQTTGDRETLQRILPKLREIISRHEHGAAFHIGVDPADGLLRQGEPGYQLTWMDAKVDGWVVTPRRGKAVEINALWYNALRLTAGWLRDEGDAAEATRLDQAADRARAAFNQRFWNPALGHLFDIVDGEFGDDPAFRPNQIFALSLAHPVLDQNHWAEVVEAVKERLLTPFGLRSLSREHPDYKPRYFGDLRARDAAYHQGTVWGWLIGPFVDAWLRVYPDRRAEARGFLTAFLDQHLDDACVGTISEIFDAEEPYTPRGCVAQAWSVAEVLRAWARTA